MTNEQLEQYIIHTSPSEFHKAFPELRGDDWLNITLNSPICFGLLKEGMIKKLTN